MLVHIFFQTDIRFLIVAAAKLRKKSGGLGSSGKKRALRILVQAGSFMNSVFFIVPPITMRESGTWIFLNTKHNIRSYITGAFWGR